MTETQIAGYQVEREIGRGEMAVVYRAKDLRLDRVVALKLFAPELARDHAFRLRVVRNSHLVMTIDHPHIVPIGEADGPLYLAMRYVFGPDLGALLDRDGPLPVTAAMCIAAQTASALDAAYEHDVVHGDVKPGNILVVGSEGSDESYDAYLTDFGLAMQAPPESRTPARACVGTPEYMAPERISGHRADGRSDLYSLACVVYETLAGSPPFQRDEDVALLWAHLNVPPPALSQASPGIAPGVQEFVAEMRSAAGSAPMP